MINNLKSQISNIVTLQICKMTSIFLWYHYSQTSIPNISVMILQPNNFGLKKHNDNYVKFQLYIFFFVQLLTFKSKLPYNVLSQFSNFNSPDVDCPNEAKP